MAEQPDILRVLSDAGITGIEIAPTKCWPGWVGATGAAALQTAGALAAAGFTVPSMQALLFGRQELKVFGSDSERVAFLNHIKDVADIAAGLGAKTLVFGSPANRDPGDLPPDQAMETAVTVMRAAGEICAQNGVWLGIEANPAVYGCKFVTRWFEAADLVRRCNSPGVKLHLDAACTILAGDDLAQAVAETTDILAHVHISEPHLGAFDSPTVDHASFGSALKNAGYKGWCSVEMRRTADPLPAIRTAAALARSYYG
ncbi:MAG TPA: sugar phosphate isomerase/epimerase family protein [Micropepsaceae bacterium]|nr:sugar phosphate isomerase/epimerase family protein [Micropepsaceae bacterium]